LPLVHIYKRDPEARIVILPSDHFILEEERFMDYIVLAERVVRRYPNRIALLGVQADGPETEYGWIEPRESVDRAFGPAVKQLGRFLEKPGPEIALEFYEKGYLWNTFVTVAKAQTLIGLAQRHLPSLWSHFERILAAIGTDREQLVIEREYRWMEGTTLSHGLFEKCPSDLLVVEMKNIYWSDWGSGERVLSTLERIGKTSTPFHGVLNRTSVL
jgi:mannose-1-phosphate guanylyltransferase